MAKPLTREQIENMHDRLQKSFTAAADAVDYLSSYTPPEKQAQYHARFSAAALALLAADQRLRELDEEPSMIKSAAAHLPGKAP